MVIARIIPKSPLGIDRPPSIMEHRNFRFFLDLDYRKLSDQQVRETCQCFEYQLQYGAVQDVDLQALATIIKCDERLYTLAATEIPSIRPCQWRSGIFAALGSFLGDDFLKDPSEHFLRLGKEIRRYIRRSAGDKPASAVEYEFEQGSREGNQFKARRDSPIMAQESSPEFERSSIDCYDCRTQGLKCDQVMLACGKCLQWHRVCNYGYSALTAERSMQLREEQSTQPRVLEPDPLPPLYHARQEGYTRTWTATLALRPLLLAEYDPDIATATEQLENPEPPGASEIKHEDTEHAASQSPRPQSAEPDLAEEQSNLCQKDLADSKSVDEGPKLSSPFEYLDRSHILDWYSTSASDWSNESLVRSSTPFPRLDYGSAHESSSRHHSESDSSPLPTRKRPRLEVVSSSPTSSLKDTTRKSPAASPSISNDSPLENACKACHSNPIESNL